MSKDAHEQIVAPLRQRLAEIDIERKKAQDEIIRLLGGKPYNFPQLEAAQELLTSGVEPDPQEDEARWLEYLKNYRPSDFPAALAKVRARGQTKVFPDPAPQKAAVAAAFEQAEQEVLQNK